VLSGWAWPESRGRRGPDWLEPVPRLRVCVRWQSERPLRAHAWDQISLKGRSARKGDLVRSALSLSRWIAGPKVYDRPNRESGRRVKCDRPLRGGSPCRTAARSRQRGPCWDWGIPRVRRRKKASTDCPQILRPQNLRAVGCSSSYKNINTTTNTGHQKLTSAREQSLTYPQRPRAKQSELGGWLLEPVFRKQAARACPVGSNGGAAPSRAASPNT
jgi:hypothetical protein